MPTPLPIRIAIWLWLICALVAGSTGVLTRLPLPALQGVLILLTALVLLAWRRIGMVRTWVEALEPSALVLLHTTRFVGIYFLLLYRRGMLPYDFAVRGGWGDIIVATLALAVCFWPLAPDKRRRLMVIWNVVGTLDLLFVLATAGRLGLAGDPLMWNLTMLPLSLLPTFLVPLLLATHFILFQRLRTAPAGATAS